jgi:hypothetical protein
LLFLHLETLFLLLLRVHDLRQGLSELELNVGTNLCFRKRLELKVLVLAAKDKTVIWLRVVADQVKVFATAEVKVFAEGIQQGLQLNVTLEVNRDANIA